MFSRYRFNRDRYLAASYKVYATPETADQAIAPVVRANGTLMGTDKWGHFFQQGYWYFYGPWLVGRSAAFSEQERKDFGEYMENKHYDGSNRKSFEQIGKHFEDVWTGAGHFGNLSTGVLSRADINANEAGYQFYKRLYDSYREVASKKDSRLIYRFKVKDYDTWGFNDCTF